MIHCLFSDEQRHNVLCSENLGKGERGISLSKEKTNSEKVSSPNRAFLRKSPISMFTLHALGTLPHDPRFACR